jgi:hypothetical protein
VTTPDHRHLKLAFLARAATSGIERAAREGDETLLGQVQAIVILCSADGASVVEIAGFGDDSCESMRLAGILAAESSIGMIAGAFLGDVETRRRGEAGDVEE